LDNDGIDDILEIKAAAGDPAAEYDKCVAEAAREYTAAVAHGKKTYDTSSVSGEMGDVIVWPVNEDPYRVKGDKFMELYRPMPRAAFTQAKHQMLRGFQRAFDKYTRKTVAVARSKAHRSHFDPNRARKLKQTKGPMKAHPRRNMSSHHAKRGGVSQRAAEATG